FRSTAFRNPAARLAAFSSVRMRVSVTSGLATSLRIRATSFGVVVRSCIGRRPSLSPNWSMSKHASASFHFATSSHHAASNCGPRKLSGSSEEKTCATAPLSHTSRLRLGSKRGRLPRETARMPEGPSIITSRTSPRVSPTRAMRPYLYAAKGGKPRTNAFTHSAPSRVLPEPRPLITSQISRSLAATGYCACRACCRLSSSSRHTSSGLVSALPVHGGGEFASELYGTGIDKGERGGQFCIAFVLFLCGAPGHWDHLPELLDHPEHGGQGI